jgi:hypothetical protein
MTETSGDVERRRQELEVELAGLADKEREQREERRRRELAEREAQLDPEQRARKTEIERRADAALEREFPPAWMPHKAGSGHPEKVVGLVLRIDPRVGPSRGFGTYAAVIEIRTTDGTEWSVWANEGGAMYAQLLRLRVQPGEVVAIQFRGKRESEANPGQSYHDFRLVRVDDDDQAAAPVDYDALTRTTETPALPAPEETPAGDDDIPF